MTTSDFQRGTTFIEINRSWFKCEGQFEKICEFLELPTDCVSIEIEVDGGNDVYSPSYKGKRFAKRGTKNE